MTKTLISSQTQNLCVTVLKLTFACASPTEYFEVFICKAITERKINNIKRFLSCLEPSLK